MLGGVMRSQFSGQELRQWLLGSLNTLTCTHIWRCLLVLAFRGVWEDFFVLIAMSYMIDNAKVVNISCGRHLFAFLQIMLEKVSRGSLEDLDQDEELLVFLSGDLQSGANSWIWGNSETGTLLSRRQKHGRPRQSISRDGNTGATSEQISWSSDLAEDELASWAGWDAVEQLAGRIRQYLPDASANPQQVFTQPDVAQTGWSTDQSPADTNASDAKYSSDSRSRMDIANII